MGFQMSLFDSPITVNDEGLLLIDGNNLMYRCYYATAQGELRRAPNGQYTNAIFLFLRMMFTYRKKLNVQIAVAFDEGKSYRHKLYPEYKKGRKEAPAPLREQLLFIQEMLKAIGVPVYSHPDYEADDLLASLAESVDESAVYILSNDRDLLQTVTSRVTVVIRKGKEDKYFTPKLFREKYAGLKPQQIIDLKAIMGDPSDNIAGIRGIGEKGATSLIQAYGSVESMIESVGTFPKELKRYEKNVDESKKDAILAKKLATLHRDIKVTSEKFQINQQKMEEYCIKLELYSILNIAL